MPQQRINVNRKEILVEAPEDMPLLWVLRDLLELTGTKYGCGIGQCGACTVLIDGSPARSCLTQVGALENKKVLTIEYYANDNDQLHPVQEAWIAADVPQCGYCQSGQIMNAIGLLDSNPSPDDDAIINFMNGNLCRCGTYPRILKAVKKAVEKSGNEQTKLT